MICNGKTEARLIAIDTIEVAQPAELLQKKLKISSVTWNKVRLYLKKSKIVAPNMADHREIQD